MDHFYHYDHFNRLKATLTAASDMICIVDRNGNALYNLDFDNWLLLTGQSFEKSVQGGWKELIHSEDVDRVEKEAKKILGGREGGLLEYRLRRVDGEWKWFSAKIVPVLDREGVVEWIWALHDITDRKLKEAEKDELILKLHEREKELAAREKELRESLNELSRVHTLLAQSQEKFEAISTSTNDAIYDWDIPNNRLEWSRGFFEIFEKELPGVEHFTIEMWKDCICAEDKKE